MSEADGDGWNCSPIARWQIADSSATTFRDQHQDLQGRYQGGNSILIKINQIGTLSETFAAVEMAKRAGLYRREVASLR